MGRTRCVICGVTNTAATVFRFPSNIGLKEKWKKQVGVNVLTPTSLVCSSHFSSEEISVHKTKVLLAPGAVPSLKLQCHESSPEPVGDAEHAEQSQPSASSSAPAAAPREDDPEEAPGQEAPLHKEKKTAQLPLGKVVTLRTATFKKLQKIKGLLNCRSVSKTVFILADRYLRREKEAAKKVHHSTPVRLLSVDANQNLLVTPTSVVTIEPRGNTEPYSPLTECSFTPGSAAQTPRRDLAEAEMLESLDIDLEVADDPGAAENELEATGDSELEDVTMLAADDPVDAAPHWDVRSAVVSEPQLRQLLTELPSFCQRCQCEVPPDVSRQSLSYQVTWKCGGCRATARQPWHSTEKEGHVVVFDTVFAAAVTLSGCSPTGVHKLLSFCNMGTLSTSAYYRIANKVVYPVIDQEYQETINANRAEAKAASPGGLTVAGDCQNDSPGFSASYGTYTLMDHTTGRIIAQNTVARQEVGLSSPREETEGARRCINDLMQAGVPIAEYVSDQHVGVKNLVGKTLPGVKYSFDIWHAAKNVGKRLNAYAVKARYKKLRPWVPHLKNHFWWCAKTCDGNAVIFKKRWMMAIHHIINVHLTRSANNECHHEPLDPEDHGLEWLTPESDAHKAVRDVVLGSRTMGLAEHVASFRHTGRLEVFHSVNNAYTPKLKFFAYGGFIAMKQVAVLDYSAHLNRPVDRNPDGTMKMKRVYTRVSDRFVLRPIKVPKSFPHVRRLLAKMADLRRESTLAGPAERRAGDPRWKTPYVHRGPREHESVESLLAEAGQHSRF